MTPLATKRSHPLIPATEGENRARPAMNKTAGTKLTQARVPAAPPIGQVIRLTAGLKDRVEFGHGVHVTAVKSKVGTSGTKAAPWVGGLAE